MSIRRSRTLTLPSRMRRLIRADAARLSSAIGPTQDLTFVRLWGNRGDELIWAGARALLRTRQYREVAGDSLGDATGQTAVMSGCGGWCEKFHGLAPDVLPKLEERFDRVIVLPSTFDPNFEPVAEVLASSRAVLFARDVVSRDLVAGLGRQIEVALDTAFFFDFRPYVRSGSGPLSAMRTDHASMLPAEHIAPNNEDISRTVATMDEWLWRIAAHDEVETDRAHVVIAAAMLGKRVRWHPTDDHKVPGIVEYSLRGFDRIVPAAAT